MAWGLCEAPIEDHHGDKGTKWVYLPEGKTVDIPYRTLLPLQVDDLLMAGRCFSSTHDAHASVRSMAQCMAMGQAVGTAAAMCVQASVTPRELNTGALRDTLRCDGAMLELGAAE